MLASYHVMNKLEYQVHALMLLVIALVSGQQKLGSGFRHL